MMRPFFLFQRYAQSPILKNMTCSEPHRGRGSETPGTKIQIMVLNLGIGSLEVNCSVLVRMLGTFIRGSGLLPTYQHRTVLPLLGHTDSPNHTSTRRPNWPPPRPRELEEVEGLDAPRPIALESRQTDPAPLAGRVKHLINQCFTI